MGGLNMHFASLYSVIKRKSQKADLLPFRLFSFVDAISVNGSTLYKLDRKQFSI
jgi:hypothetical protein